MNIPIEKMLDLAVKRNCSDVHMVVGKPPTVRLNGRLRSMEVPVLEPEDTVQAMKAITPDRYQEELEEKGGADFGFTFRGETRFRVSIYHDRGHVSLALRQLPNRFFTFEEIGLPPSVKDLCLRPRGLLLVTGPTGCGKTTTQATMLDFINTETDQHIITIEDPIEYIHKHKKSLVSQREVGVDVNSFEEAVWRSLRQDPDVVLIGEMRELKTMEAALRAAETGHLVFATLHTTGAARTVNRIIDNFPVQQQAQIRAQLSVTLVAVISQELLPRADGSGVVAAFEIMTMTPSIANLIRENLVHRISSDIQTGRRHGMILLDDSLHEFYRAGIISFSEMMRRAQEPELLHQKIKEQHSAEV